MCSLGMGGDKPRPYDEEAGEGGYETRAYEHRGVWLRRLMMIGVEHYRTGY